MSTLFVLRETRGVVLSAKRALYHASPVRLSPLVRGITPLKDVNRTVYSYYGCSPSFSPQIGMQYKKAEDDLTALTLSNKSQTLRKFHNTRPVLTRKKHKKKSHRLRRPIFIPTPINPDDIVARIPENAEYPQDFEVMDEEDTLQKAWLDKWDPNSGLKKRIPLKTYNLDEFDYYLTDKFLWTTRHKRCGAIGLKLGMIPVWDDWGVRHACTVIHLENNVVLRVKSSKEVDGYNAVVVGAGEYKKKNLSKPLLGVYAKYGVHEHPPYVVREFRISNVEGQVISPEPGTKLHARHFLAGQCVDIAGISKGKGFQGGMKRHNFGGMPASHGTSKTHRAIGSTGQCQDPGRVFKGKKMPGRMGCDRVTTQNLRIIKIDRGLDLLFVRGAVPGNRGGFVEIRDAVKRPLFGTDLVEFGAEGSATPPLPTFEYDDDIDGSGKLGFEVMKPLEERDPDEPINEAA